MTTYYLNDVSLNWILTSNTISSNSVSGLNIQTLGRSIATFNNLGLILEPSGNTITTAQNSNLILDASNSNIIFSRNSVQYAIMDTSFNFTIPPNCSVNATLPTNLINKSYFDASFGTWISFTPTTYQPYPTTVSTSTNTAYYFRVGKLVTARYYIVYNATGSLGNSIAITLPPVTASSNYTGLGQIASNCIGSASWYDANAQFSGVYQFNLSANLSNTAVGFFYLYGGQSTTGGSWFGQFPAVQIRTGHVFSATITYEAA